MARVRRGGRNRLEFPGVILKFQLYPGDAGASADRGVSGVAYSVTIAGHLWQSDTTDAEGTVAVSMPPGHTTFVLHILGVDYTVNVDPSLEPLVKPRLAGQEGNTSIPHLPSVRRRLELLGLYVGTPDDDLLDLDAEDAILQLQANAGIDADGLVGDHTRDALAHAVGEG